jgi:hypothetical protein
MIYRCFLVLSLLSAVLVVSCSSAAAPSVASPAPAIVATQVPVATPAPTQVTAPTLASTTVPTQPPKPTAPLSSATAGPTSPPGTFGQADLDKIFPPGKGQDLVFQACVNCHTWVPIVLAGFDESAWEQNKLNHRNRVSSLSDADFNFLYNYLEQTFPAGHPVPTNIPPDLLKEWTSY